MAEASVPRRNPVIALLLFLTASYAAGFVGALATNQSLPFSYIVLNKPAWAPPGWLFAPVWTVLYGLMSWAAWLVWSVPPVEVPSGRRTWALTMFFVQLVLNALWPWIFFGWQQLRIGLFEICLLWLAILATAIMFARIRPTAGWMLAPYLAWVTYAAALNWAIFRLNH